MPSQRQPGAACHALRERVPRAQLVAQRASARGQARQAAKGSRSCSGQQIKGTARSLCKLLRLERTLMPQRRSPCCCSSSRSHQPSAGEAAPRGESNKQNAAAAALAADPDSHRGRDCTTRRCGSTASPHRLATVPLRQRGGNGETASHRRRQRPCEVPKLVDEIRALRHVPRKSRTHAAAQVQLGSRASKHAALAWLIHVKRLPALGGLLAGARGRGRPGRVAGGGPVPVHP